MLSIRTPEWKYVSYPYESAKEGNYGELYNLSKDPNEIKNLIHSPESLSQLRKMERLLKKAKKQYAYTEPPYKYKAPKASGK